MSVRFLGLKCCPTPPLITPLKFMLVIVNIKPTSIETSVDMKLQLNNRVKKTKQKTELLLLKADCRRLGLVLTSVSSSSL